MPFIIDGGGGTPSPTPTPVPFPIATSQVDVYVDNTSTGVATRTGNIAAPFLTIQEALNKIGKPTSSADSLRLMCVHVSSGNYTETLNVPEGRMIKIVCHGWVNFTGNINYLSDGNARLGSGIRSFLSISGIDNNLATSTHIGRQGGMTINGRIIRKCTSVTGITTHDLYLSNVVVTGGIGYDSSIAQAGGTSLYLVRSRLQGTTSDQVADSGTGFPLAIQQIEDSKIEGTLKVSRLGGATRTEFASCAMTVLQAGGDIPPFGYYDCLFTGSTSLTAPAGAFKLNGVSYKNAASVPLSGGVAREYIEDFTPLATGTTDNAVTRFDGTTGLLQTSGVTIDDTNNVKGAASVQLTGGTGTDGTVSWNDGDGTIDIALKGGQTVLQVGQEQVARVLNNTGAALSDGQVVYITGAQGQRPTVALADADIEATSSATIGIVTEPIANGAEGFVTLSGLVRNIDTSAWAEGAQLYVSGTAGALTTTKPIQPAHAVRIGWVVRQHATSGSILVHVQNGYELDELHDVLLATPTNRQSLAYETASGLWKNTTLTKSDVGLANVDNTSDANKPVSSATQTALDGKQSVTLGLPDIRPSLLLDFANSQTVDPRITFTRASTATRTNARQLIEIVSANTPRIDYDPVTGQCKGLLIEESRTNLLTYSEQFDDAAWGKNRSSITANAATAPDGTLSADRLVEDTTSGSHNVSRLGFSFTASATYTVSVYAKPAGRNFVTLRTSGLAFGASLLYFNLTTGAVTVDTAGGVTASSATYVGNGWYRCVATFTATSTTIDNLIFDAAQDTSTFVYAGDGTSGLYIWGAQLEAGAFPTSYVPSTVTFASRASSGTYFGSDGLLKTATTNEARLNHNPTNLTVAPKLLLEAAATNLLTYSERFDDVAWPKGNASITANVTIAPDATLSADKIVEDAANTTHRIAAVPSISAGTTYTFSLFAKAAERSAVMLSFGADASAFPITQAFFSLTGAGSFVDNGGTPNAVITNVGNGWYRCSITATASTTTTHGVVRIFVCNGTTIGSETYQGDGTSGIFVWGAQLEAGTFPTSYIQTVATTVTRAADVSTSAAATRAADVASMTGTNFSSWFSPNLGTISVDWALPVRQNDNNAFYSITSTGGNLGAISSRMGFAAFRRVRSYAQDASGVFQYSSEGLQNDGTSGRSATSFSPANQMTLVDNGGAAQTAATGAIQSLSLREFYLGKNGNAYLNGHLAKLAYYPKPLANTELQALTS